jgi:hypothetical protein
MLNKLKRLVLTTLIISGISTFAIPQQANAQQSGVDNLVNNLYERDEDQCINDILVSMLDLIKSNNFDEVKTLLSNNDQLVFDSLSEYCQVENFSPTPKQIQFVRIIKNSLELSKRNTQDYTITNDTKLEIKDEQEFQIISEILNLDQDTAIGIVNIPTE